MVTTQVSGPIPLFASRSEGSQNFRLWTRLKSPVKHVPGPEEGAAVGFLLAQHGQTLQMPMGFVRMRGS